MCPVNMYVPRENICFQGTYLGQYKNSHVIICNYFNAIVLNHLYYEDDCCLLCPSVYGLNELLSISAKYAIHRDIVFNKLKCVFVF